MAGERKARDLSDEELEAIAARADGGAPVEAQPSPDDEEHTQVKAQPAQPKEAPPVADKPKTPRFAPRPSPPLTGLKGPMAAAEVPTGSMALSPRVLAIHDVLTPPVTPENSNVEAGSAEQYTRNTAKALWRLGPAMATMPGEVAKQAGEYFNEPVQTPEEGLGKTRPPGALDYAGRALAAPIAAGMNAIVKPVGNYLLDQVPLALGGRTGPVASFQRNPLGSVEEFAMPLAMGAGVAGKLNRFVNPPPVEAPIAAAPQQATPRGVPQLPPAPEPEPIQAYPYTPDQPAPRPPPPLMLPPGESQQSGPPQLPPGTGNYDPIASRPPIIEVPRGGFDAPPEQPNRPGFADTLRNRRQAIRQAERQAAAEARDRAWRGKGYTGTENLERRVPGQVEQPAPQTPVDPEVQELKADVADLKGQVQDLSSAAPETPSNRPAPAAPEASPSQPAARRAPIQRTAPPPEPDVSASEAIEGEEPPGGYEPPKREAPIKRPVVNNRPAPASPDPNKGPTTEVNRAIGEDARGPFRQAPAKTGAAKEPSSPHVAKDLGQYQRGFLDSQEGRVSASKHPDYLAGVEDEKASKQTERQPHDKSVPRRK